MARAAKQTCKVLMFPSRGNFEQQQQKVAQERWDKQREETVRIFLSQYQALCWDAPPHPCWLGRTIPIDDVVWSVASSLLREVEQLLQLRDRTQELPDAN